MLSLWFYLALAFGVETPESRVALVVGNSHYRHSTELPNADDDARAIAATLERVGFDLIGGKGLTDLDLDGMLVAVDDFRKALETTDVGLFYFAGHGLQIDGKNYLVPVDAKLDRRLVVPARAVGLDVVLAQMADRTVDLPTNLLFLDACRNNPFASSWDGSSRSEPALGLAPPPTPSSTYVMYATAANKVALDGDGDHSPFATALLEHLPATGIGLGELGTKVALHVHNATDGMQQPWITQSLLRNFSFAPGDGPVTAPVAKGPQPIAGSQPTGLPSLDAPLKLNKKVGQDAAVVIGNEHYPLLSADARYANHDSRMVYDFLTHTRGIPVSKVRLVADGNRERMLRAVSEAASTVGEDGRLWVYFSGLSVPSPRTGEPMWLGNDAPPDGHIHERGVSVAEIQSSARQAKVILITDSCATGRDRAGNALLQDVRSLGPPVQTPVLEAPLVPIRATEPREIAHLSAGGAHQRCHVLDSVETSAFTYFLVGAMRGWADGQTGGDVDGEVSLGEAHAYIKMALRNARFGSQQPVLVGTADASSITLAVGVEQAAPTIHSEPSPERDLSGAKGPEEVAALLGQKCEDDQGWSCAVLGGMYDTGFDLERDSERSAALYKRACNLGYRQACAAVISDSLCPLVAPAGYRLALGRFEADNQTAALEGARRVAIETLTREVCVGATELECATRGRHIQQWRAGSWEALTGQACVAVVIQESW